MRTTFGGAAVMIVAAALGWFARGVDWKTEEPRPQALVTSGSPPVEGSRVTPVRVEPQDAVADDFRGGRNLFAYRERAVTPARIAIVPPLVPSVTVIAPRDTVPDVAPPPSFPWRYIGTIGHDHDPIAVFARDGEIVNVRRGERIDDTFTLREIGVESVEVEESAGRRRIPLGSR